MAAWTYTDLLEAVATWAHRTNLTDQIPDFISLAEDEINTEMRLRLMQVDESLTLASGARTIALPTRYLEPIKLELVISGQDNEQLSYVVPAQMVVNASSDAASQPRYWTINGDTIEFPTLADQAYSINFRMLKGFDIATTLTNALLTSYRGLYLYGALMQAAPYMVNDARIGTWQGMYEKLKAKVAKREGRNQALAKLRTDLPGTGPGFNILRG